MEYAILIFAHILGAGIWTSGNLLVALAYLPQSLSTRDTAPLLEFEKRFELAGIVALFVQFLTGFRLAILFEPLPANWFSFDSRVTTHLGLKFLLFAATGLMLFLQRSSLLTGLKKSLPWIAFRSIFMTLLALSLMLAGVSLRIGGIF